MNSADLAERFRTRLGSTLPPFEVDLFRADLARANLDLMAAALEDTRQIVARAGPPHNPRDAVLARYNLKLAEIAQLFPIFFIFESAFRSFASARLALSYGDDQWWKPIRDTVARRGNLHSLHRLGNQPARRDVVDTVTHLIKGMGPGAAAVVTTYDLLEGGTLAHVERLIKANWTAIEAAFRQPAGRPPFTQRSFNDQFRLVRNARNDAYHHRTVSNRSRVLEIMEQLLDLLDISLDARLQAISNARLAPLQFSIPIGPHHS